MIRYKLQSSRIFIDYHSLVEFLDTRSAATAYMHTLNFIIANYCLPIDSIDDLRPKA